jgi:hypothetical protein
MKHPWFRSWGWIYLPASWQGVIVTFLGIAFSAQVFAFVDTHSHSVSDTLYGIFPYIVPCWILVYWVASKSSAPRSSDPAA